MIEWTLAGESKRLADVPKDAIITSVDDIECVGMCEECGAPVLENRPYIIWDDGIVTHKECPKRGAGEGGARDSQTAD